MDMPFRIPDALMPFLIGAGLWYGGCLLYFSPVLTTRAIDLHVAAECSAGANPEICPCVLTDIKTGSGVFKNALFLSTFSLSDPRVDLFGNSRNPYIEYISVEARDKPRRDACDAPLSDAIAQAEKSAEIKAQLERERIQKRHDAEMEKQRIANQKLADEAARQITTVTDAAKNSPLAEEAKKKFDQGKRVYELQDETTDEVLNWWEWAVYKSKRLRNDLERR